MTVRFELYDDPDGGLWLFTKRHSQVRWSKDYGAEPKTLLADLVRLAWAGWDPARNNIGEYPSHRDGEDRLDHYTQVRRSYRNRDGIYGLVLTHEGPTNEATWQDKTRRLFNGE